MTEYYGVRAGRSCATIAPCARCRRRPAAGDCRAGRRGGPADRSPAPLQPRAVRNGRAARARGGRASLPAPTPPRVVLGRIQLERFRQSADQRDLDDARANRFAWSTRRRSTPRERVELTIGLAEALYLEDRFGAAAQLFESVRRALGAARHARARARARLVGDRARSPGAGAPARGARRRSTRASLDRMTRGNRARSGIRRRPATGWPPRRGRSGDLDRALARRARRLGARRARRRSRRRASRRPRPARDAGASFRSAQPARCPTARSPTQAQAGDDRRVGSASRRRGAK